MATSSRDARRRRIVERGSDRLALITGRIQTLPSSSSSESYHSHTESYPPLISNDQDLRTPLPDQPNTVPPQSEDKASGSLLSKHDSDTKPGQLDTNDGGSRVGPFMLKCETSAEAFRASALECDSKVQSSLVSSTVQHSSISPSDTERHFEPRTRHRKFFTPNQISSAMAASESSRIYCSLATAILVVLSYLGFPVLGSHTMKSLLINRPLCLVLMTNISIVLARLLLEKERGLEKSVQETDNVPSIGGNGLAEQVGKALELGLVLQNVMGAVFMDYSIYAIVVVCGLSLAQGLGW